MAMENIYIGQKLIILLHVWVHGPTWCLQSWKGLYRSVNIENYRPKLQYRSAILSIHDSTRTSTQLYASVRGFGGKGVLDKNGY